MMIPCGVRFLILIIFSFFDRESIKMAHFSLRTGIAYTIDPVYEVEVRDYLGQTPLPPFFFIFIF